MVTIGKYLVIHFCETRENFDNRVSTCGLSIDEGNELRQEVTRNVIQDAQDKAKQKRNQRENEPPKESSHKKVTINNVAVIKAEYFYWSLDTADKKREGIRKQLIPPNTDVEDKNTILVIKIARVNLGTYPL